MLILLSEEDKKKVAELNEKLQKIVRLEEKCKQELRALIYKIEKI